MDKELVGLRRVDDTDSQVRRYDNITCVDYVWKENLLRWMQHFLFKFKFNSSKRYSGCRLHDNGHAHHQHLVKDG